MLWSCVSADALTAESAHCQQACRAATQAISAFVVLCEDVSRDAYMTCAEVASLETRLMAAEEIRCTLHAQRLFCFKIAQSVHGFAAANELWNKSSGKLRHSVNCTSDTACLALSVSNGMVCTSSYARFAGCHNKSPLPRAQALCLASPCSPRSSVTTNAVDVS